jgi:hypothetical protein
LTKPLANTVGGKEKGKKRRRPAKEKPTIKKRGEREVKNKHQDK